MDTILNQEPVNILDCTLRDGGYYNNWDFDPKLVQAYLNAMEQASIDVIEIGFRSPPKRSFMGPFIYSLDNYLETLPLPKQALIGLMINANDYLDKSDKPEDLIDKMIKRLLEEGSDTLIAAIKESRGIWLANDQDVNLINDPDMPKHLKKKHAKILIFHGFTSVLVHYCAFCRSKPVL